MARVIVRLVSKAPRGRVQRKAASTPSVADDRGFERLSSPKPKPLSRTASVADDQGFERLSSPKPKPLPPLSVLKARLAYINSLQINFAATWVNKAKPFYFFYIVQEYNALCKFGIINAPTIKASLFSRPRNSTVRKLIAVMKAGIAKAIAKSRGPAPSKLRDFPDDDTPKPRMSPVKSKLRDFPPI